MFHACATSNECIGGLETAGAESGVPKLCCGGGLDTAGAESGVMFPSGIEVLEELLLVCKEGGFISEKRRRKSIGIAYG